MKILTIIFLALILTVVNAAPTEKQMLETLNEYYSAAVNEDLEKFIEVQDELFLEILFYGKENMKTYFQAKFELVNTIDFKINNPAFLHFEEYSLLFYNFNSNIEFKEDQSKEFIDNDMVAAFWHYSEKPKIRWIMTQELLEIKMEAEIANETAAIISIESMDEERSGKTEFFELGLITEEEFEAALSEYDLDTEKLPEKTGEQKSETETDATLLIIVIIIAIAGFIGYKNQEKIKETMNKTISKK